MCSYVLLIGVIYIEVLITWSGCSKTAAIKPAEVPFTNLTTVVWPNGSVPSALLIDDLDIDLVFIFIDFVFTFLILINCGED